MILIFRPMPPFIEFCKVEKNKISIDKTVFSPSVIEKIIDDPVKIEGIGYFLSHGGEIFSDTVTILTKDSLDKMRKCAKYSPEDNDLTLKIAGMLLKKFPEKPQMIFCDTAYFVDLSMEASTYAVPYALREQGIRKYGRYGLIHNWVWAKTQEVSNKSVDKVISVHLGDNPNIVAIKNGKPIETTIGFTSAEGLPSFGGCGDIDPTIVFQLHSKGIFFDRIFDLLSNESGFTAIADEECHYSDMVAENIAPNIAKVKQILRYDIIKYIGAFISLMGGLDLLVFVAKNLERSKNFMAEICDDLSFLGFSHNDIMKKTNSVQGLSNKTLKAKVLCLDQSPWNIMAKEIEKIIKKEI